MCGAFSVIHPFRDLSQKFNAGYNESYPKPRYNVRPSQPVPAVFDHYPNKIEFAMWGITKHFGDKKIFFINARNDSMEKRTWRKLLETQRCLILADGFYEWQKQEHSKTKVPYRFELKSKEPFAFAGLWQTENDVKGRNVPHVVIITTEPNKLVEPVHNRMPVILTPNNGKNWLNPDIDFDQAIAMLTPYPANDMRAYPISTLVNKPINDSAEIIAPAENSK